MLDDFDSLKITTLYANINSTLNLTKGTTVGLSDDISKYNDIIIIFRYMNTGYWYQSEFFSGYALAMMLGPAVDHINAYSELSVNTNTQLKVTQAGASSVFLKYIFGRNVIFNT